MVLYQNSEINVHELSKLLESDKNLQILDIREDSERNHASIDGTHHIKLSEIAITSNVNIIETQDHHSNLFFIDEIKDIFVEVKKASGNKCARCWRILEEVKNIGEICLRCDDVITMMDISSLKK